MSATQGRDIHTFIGQGSISRGGFCTALYAEEDGTGDWGRTKLGLTLGACIAGIMQHHQPSLADDGDRYLTAVVPTHERANRKERQLPMLSMQKDHFGYMGKTPARANGPTL